MLGYMVGRPILLGQFRSDERQHAVADAGLGLRGQQYRSVMAIVVIGVISPFDR